MRRRRLVRCGKARNSALNILSEAITRPLQYCTLAFACSADKGYVLKAREHVVARGLAMRTAHSTKKHCFVRLKIYAQLLGEGAGGE